MKLEDWKAKYGEDTTLTIEQVLAKNIKELEDEVVYFEKKGQTHFHQDIWIKFLEDIVAGKDPIRKDWSNWG